ncbi:unnamed protein product [Mucor hiemalis]
MMMSLILYTLVTLSYLIQLIFESLLSTTSFICKRPSATTTATEKETIEEPDESLYTNPTEGFDDEKETIQQRDQLLSSAMEFVHSWISVTTKEEELLSNSFNAKSIVLNHSSSLFNKENNSYALAYSLSVLVASAINLPTLSLQYILFLTHAFRVSTVELQNFITCLLTFSSNNVQTIQQQQPELLKRENYNINSTVTDVKHETTSVSILEKLNHLQAELRLTLPNHVAPIIISPTASSTLSKRDSIASMDSSSSFTTNNSTSTSITSSCDDKDAQYEIFSFKENDSIIQERLNPFNATHDNVIAFKSRFYSVKSKIDATLKYDQGFRFIYKNRSLQVENAVKNIIQNCNFMESRLIQFQSEYVFSQLYKFISTFVVETKGFIEKLAREKTVVDHEDLMNLESRVYSNITLIRALSQAFPPHNLSTMCDSKRKELSNKSQDLLNHFTIINNAWNKINVIESILADGKTILSTLNLSDDSLYLHGKQFFQTVNFLQAKIYTNAHEEFQLLSSESFIHVLQKTSYKALSCHERLVSTMIYSVMEKLQTFKNDLIGSTIIIQKYLSKQELKRDIEHASFWLKTFKCNLVTFSLLDGCMSPTSLAFQEELFDFQVQYDRFLLSQYNDICDYFTRYSNNMMDELYKKKGIEFGSYQADDLNYQQLGDDYLYEEYQWFVQLQTLCDEISRSLKVLNVLCH